MPTSTPNKTKHIWMAELSIVLISAIKRVRTCCKGRYEQNLPLNELQINTHSIDDYQKQNDKKIYRKNKREEAFLK